MSEAELTHALGDNVDQELLVRNNLGCFLEELSRHMAQGSDGAGCFRPELKNGWRAGGESGGHELRRDHENGALTLRALEMVVNRFCSGQFDCRPRGTQDRQSGMSAREAPNEYLRRN